MNQALGSGGFGALMERGACRRAVISAAVLSALFFAAASNATAGPPFGAFIDPRPRDGNRFGETVVALSTGNVVITSPGDDAAALNAGAVYLFNGATGALISTLTGSRAHDSIGSGGVTKLTNGNCLVLSPAWDNGAVIEAGAVTWANGTTGISGVVSASNSLVGSTAYDRVSLIGTTLLSNPPLSSYAVSSVTALTNGNYAVGTPSWTNGTILNAGAVTWGSGNSGVAGAISASNSLVGAVAGDTVGASGVVALTNGHYVVGSPYWNNGSVADAGAATWGNGTTGVSGLVSATNSLVGATAGDWVAGSGSGTFTPVVAALANGNYIVISREWDNAAVKDVGAVTWGNGTTGTTGPVSGLNSLVGSLDSDRVGQSGVTPLINGNYVVASPVWDNGAAANAGAATWGNGSSGTFGAVSASNSLVGSTAGDQVGVITPLTNGNYVVGTHFWDNGAVANVGAVTWGNGATGISGAVSTSNSLVGTTADDGVGRDVSALTNGNYVAVTVDWRNGAV